MAFFVVVGLREIPIGRLSIPEISSGNSTIYISEIVLFTSMKLYYFLV